MSKVRNKIDEAEKNTRKLNKIIEDFDEELSLYYLFTTTKNVNIIMTLFILMLSCVPILDVFRTKDIHLSIYLILTFAVPLTFNFSPIIHKLKIIGDKKLKVKLSYSKTKFFFCYQLPYIFCVVLLIISISLIVTYYNYGNVIEPFIIKYFNYIYPIAAVALIYSNVSYFVTPAPPLIIGEKK